jgi:glycosyltransferase involved in cell wall biosynthesis
MNCHNGELFLDEALESVFKQTYRNWEIIFWDNNSSDRTRQIVEKYKSEKIKYFYSNKLHKICKARNLALEKCSGQVITFLDSDDIWLDYKLKEQILYYKKGHKIIYGGYQIINEDGTKTDSIKQYNVSGYITRNLLLKNLISQGCVMIERDLIKKFKFNQFYDLLGDYDLWVRLSLKYKIISINKILEFSRQHKRNYTKIYKNRMLKEQRYFYLQFAKKYNIFKYPELFIYFLRVEIKNLLINLEKFFLKFSKNPKIQ